MREAGQGIRPSGHASKVQTCSHPIIQASIQRKEESTGLALAALIG